MSFLPGREQMRDGAARRADSYRRRSSGVDSVRVRNFGGGFKLATATWLVSGVGRLQYLEGEGVFLLHHRRRWQKVAAAISRRESEGIRGGIPAIKENPRGLWGKPAEGQLPSSASSRRDQLGSSAKLLSLGNVSPERPLQLGDGFQRRRDNSTENLVVS